MDENATDLKKLLREYLQEHAGTKNETMVWIIGTVFVAIVFIGLIACLCKANDECIEIIGSFSMTMAVPIALIVICTIICGAVCCCKNNKKNDGSKEYYDFLRYLVNVTMELEKNKQKTPTDDEVLNKIQDSIKESISQQVTDMFPDESKITELIRNEIRLALPKEAIEEAIKKGLREAKSIKEDAGSNPNPAIGKFLDIDKVIEIIKATYGSN